MKTKNIKYGNELEKEKCLLGSRTMNGWNSRPRVHICVYWKFMAANLVLTITNGFSHEKCWIYLSVRTLTFGYIDDSWLAPSWHLFEWHKQKIRKIAMTTLFDYVAYLLPVVCVCVCSCLSHFSWLILMWCLGSTFWRWCSPYEFAVKYLNKWPHQLHEGLFPTDRFRSEVNFLVETRLIFHYHFDLTRAKYSIKGEK